MQNNLQRNQVCTLHDKIAEYYCLDHSCKINELQCYLCIALDHSNCEDQTIIDADEFCNTVQIDQNSQNYVLLEESINRITEEQQKCLLEQLKKTWLSKLSQIQNQKDKTSVNIDDLLQDKQNFKIIQRDNKLQVIKKEEESSIGDYEVCKKRISQIFDQFQKKIEKFNMQIPNKLSRHNFLAGKKELKFKQQGPNQALIKTSKIYTTANLISKFPLKNFVLEFNLSDKSSQKHSLGFHVQKCYFQDNFSSSSQEMTFTILNNKSLSLKLLDKEKTISKPVSNNVKGIFKDENQKLSLYLEDIQDAVFEVQYKGNLFFYFRAEKVPVNLFINLIK